MARSTTPAGIGYKDKHDLNDKVFTPADSEFVAVTVDSAVRGVHTELDRCWRCLVSARHRQWTHRRRH